MIEHICRFHLEYNMAYVQMKDCLHGREQTKTMRGKFSERSKSITLAILSNTTITNENEWLHAFATTTVLPLQFFNTFSYSLNNTLLLLPTITSMHEHK